jgi:hypothetical protein
MASYHGRPEANSDMELTIDDVKGVVGALVIEGIVKDKRIKQLEDEIAQLKQSQEKESNLHLIEKGGTS